MARANDSERLARFIHDHRRVFVLTGAGCSTNSGIPDYRDSAGQWKRQPPVYYREFVRHAHVRRRYWARSMAGWPRVRQARPNAAHYALAALQGAGFVHELVTQNVDGLHQRAGAVNVIDLHGCLDHIECLGCNRRLSRGDYQQQLTEQNHGLQWCAPAAPDGDAELDGVDLYRFSVPDCAHCGGIYKPSVVFFGEAVPRDRVAAAYSALNQSDAMLVVGSSLMVFSGYRFCRAAVRQHKPVAAINIGRTRADSELTLKFEACCTELLAAIMSCLPARRLPASR